MADLNQLRYTKTHEWLRLDGGKATVGITHHAQEEISEVVFVELPQIGKSVKQGEEIAVVESVKAAFSIYAPISGKVVQANDALSKDPGLINRSSYEEGWIAVLEEVQTPDPSQLLSLEQYEAWAKGEGKVHS